MTATYWAGLLPDAEQRTRGAHGAAVGSKLKISLGLGNLILVMLPAWKSFSFGAHLHELALAGMRGSLIRQRPHGKSRETPAVR